MCKWIGRGRLAEGRGRRWGLVCALFTYVRERGRRSILKNRVLCRSAFERGHKGGGGLGV